VLCQKGQKSASDPTPNQDNYFISYVANYGIYGVCDGHGPFGHLVSFRLVQTLPKLITTNPHFGKNWEACLKESFLAVQKELLGFCEKQDINVEASGAAGTVVVFDGVSAHVAHIGDARVMLASWNRHNSQVIWGTEDHKPQVPEERKRLEDAGSEVRDDQGDGESFRIYKEKGSTFPGLTMSRAFGDTACAGVVQEPAYRQVFMQPTDEWYAIIASDGIWEFLDFEMTLKLTAKKLRLKGPLETVRFLTEQSRKCWAQACGDYCDDITALLVQWNCPAKNMTHNHVVRVARHE
jgi:serine/threonine protein phosphatase PrpC